MSETTERKHGESERGVAVTCNLCGATRIRFGPDRTCGYRDCSGQLQELPAQQTDEEIARETALEIFGKSDLLCCKDWLTQQRERAEPIILSAIQRSKPSI